MQNIKRILSIILFVCIVSVQIPVYADDNLEEDMDSYEINGFIEEVGAEVQKMPDINSRYAAIYDRTSRSSFIWKKRK